MPRPIPTPRYHPTPAESQAAAEALNMMLLRQALGAAPVCWCRSCDDAQVSGPGEQCAECLFAEADYRDEVPGYEVDDETERFEP